MHLKSVLIYIFIIFKYGNSVKYKYGKNAVVSNYKLCAEIGMNLIKQGGNGYDAAIGIMLCEGVAKPQDMGLGGGFMGIIKRNNKQAIYVNSREIAPLNTNVEIFNHSVSNKIFGKTVGIPSALKGYGYLKKHSKLSWKEICTPVINMATNGFPVVIGEVLNKKQYEYIEETNRDIFINPDTELPYQNNEIWKRPDLAKTIYDISEHGSSLFYSSKYSYRKTIKKEINSRGGDIVDEDFDNVKVNIGEPLTSYFKFNNKKYMLQTTPLPGGGITLEFILRIMEKYYMTINIYEQPLKQLHKKLHKQSYKYNKNEMYYVLTEAFKFAFAFRDKLGDPNFNNMDKIINHVRNPATIDKIYKKIMINKHTSNNTKYYNMKTKPVFDTGTANIITKTPNEIIVITSSINLRFGSWIVSKYGFIYNNQLSDFSIPNRSDAGHLLSNTSYNYPEPLKYPVSSMATSIVSRYNKKLDKYLPKYIIGAAGGPKIITSIAQVLNSIMGYDKNIVDSIYMPRYHHQLVPEYVTVEKDFYKLNKNFIKKYKYTIDPVFMRGDYSAVTGLQIHNKTCMSGTYDPRRPGGVYVF